MGGDGLTMVKTVSGFFLSIGGLEYNRGEQTRSKEGHDGIVYIYSIPPFDGDLHDST